MMAVICERPVFCSDDTTKRGPEPGFGRDSEREREFVCVRAFADDIKSGEPARRGG